MKDITEICTGEGKLWLCVVLDLYSQLVVGWSMHHRQDRQMVIRVIKMAVWQREGQGQIILHSDRGSQFRSFDYQSFLKANNLVSSISAVGHCGDNAACDGFFGLIKRDQTTASDIRLERLRERIFSTILRCSTTRKCGGEWLNETGSMQSIQNRSRRQGRTPQS